MPTRRRLQATCADATPVPEGVGSPPHASCHGRGEAALPRSRRGDPPCWLQPDTFRWCPTSSRTPCSRPRRLAVRDLIRSAPCRCSSGHSSSGPQHPRAARGRLGVRRLHDRAVVADHPRRRRARAREHHSSSRSLTFIALPLILLTFGRRLLLRERRHPALHRVGRRPTSRSTASGRTSARRS